MNKTRKAPIKHGLWCGRINVEQAPGKARKWVLSQPLTFRLEDSAIEITVKPGARTDGASIPRPLWILIGGPMRGRYLAAAIVHDQLYATQGYERRFNRAEVDRIFYVALRSLRVRLWRALLMYWGVRVFGGAHWARQDPREAHLETAFLTVKFSEEEPS